MTEKRTGRIPPLAEKSHIWKESGVMPQCIREVEVGTLLIGNYKNTVWWAKIWWLAVITLFCPLSDALRNHHIHFFCACSYTTKLWSPVLLAFQLPFKSRTCYVQEISYSKKLQQLSIRSFRHSVKWKCMDE